jgi:hypothetical protein
MGPRCSCAGQVSEDAAFLANLKKFGAIPFYWDSQGMKEYVRKVIEEATKFMAPASK